MSADHYAICPRCRDEAKADYETRQRRLREAYGAMPVDEYEALSKAAEAFDEERFRTFREEWEFFDASTGTVKMSYGGECDRCGLSVTFDGEKKFYEPKEATE